MDPKLLFSLSCCYVIRSTEFELITCVCAILIQILKLLKGEAYIDDIVNFRGSEELHDVDDIFPKFVSKPSLSFALRDTDYDSTSSNKAYTTSNTAAKKTRRLKLKDYLKEQQE